MTPLSLDEVYAALAQLMPEVPPGELLIGVSVRPGSAARYGERSGGMPLHAAARHVHAALVGIPVDPMPTVDAPGDDPRLWELQATADAADAERVKALRRVAELEQQLGLRDTGAAA